MDDGQEVIAKVPNPNSGTPYFTTASEVATMDFVGYLSCAIFNYSYFTQAGIGSRNIECSRSEGLQA